MRALKDLPSLEKMEYEQDIYGITYGNILEIIANVVAAFIELVDC